MAIYKAAQHTTNSGKRLAQRTSVRSLCRFTLCLLLAASAHASNQSDLSSIVFIYSTKGNQKEIGTGFFIDSSGTFVTAYHTVVNSKTVEVYDSENRKRTDASILVADEINDVAILSIYEPVKSYFKLGDRSPDRSMRMRAIGHPYGSPFHTFEVRSTRDGFSSSLSIYSNSGEPVFRKPIDLVSTDLTVYNGMSGGPIITEDGEVIALVAGSLNVGGSLGWGIPAKAILRAVSLAKAARGTPPSAFSWRPLESYGTGWRGFAVPKAVGVDEAMSWIRKKYETNGLGSFDVGGFTASVSENSLTYNASERTVTHSAKYSVAGDEFRRWTTIRLEDAIRSTPVSSTRNYVTVECPPDRACAEWKLERKTSAGIWRTVEHRRGTVARFDALRFDDQDSTGRVAAAISHLIALHGGPVQRSELFDKK